MKKNTLRAESPSIFLDKSGRGRNLRFLFPELSRKDRSHYASRVEEKGIQSSDSPPPSPPHPTPRRFSFFQQALRCPHRQNTWNSLPFSLPLLDF